MPALNMGSPAAPIANPGTGVFVLMSPFSGPTGAPFGAMKANGYNSNMVMQKVAETTNFSVGALNTGIGFGNTPIIGPTAPQSIKDRGYSDDYTPGVTLPSGAAATTAILTAIGGGKSAAASGGVAATTPYTAQPLLGFGGGQVRDAGAGPAFTGFGIKTVTAAAGVAKDAAVETGFLNRSGVALTAGQSVFGSYVAASAAVA